MPYYLFCERLEEAARRAPPEKQKEAEWLKQFSGGKTAHLTTQHGRITNRHDDRSKTKELVEQMGTKLKSPGLAHARDYVDEWTRVSDNCGLIRKMVHAEVDAAYGWGLDTRSPEVIGIMYFIACYLWSELGEYSSPTQDEGKR
jgi:hypothetical protein